MKLLVALALAFGTQFADAQLFCSCPTITSVATNLPGNVTIVDRTGAHVKFKYNGTYSLFTGQPTFSPFVVLPSTETTPAMVFIGANLQAVALLNPSLQYNLDVQFITVDQTPPSTVHVNVLLTLSKDPPPSIDSVVNAASLLTFLSPGALVSVRGSHLTGPTMSTTYDDTGLYPTSIASTSVTFNGIAAPLLYVSPGQINVIAPFALAGQTSAKVTVQRFDQVSSTITVPLQDTSPGVFASTQNGTGQGAILQQGSNGLFTPNSSANPAPRGAALELFATGAGVWTPPAQSDIFLFPEDFKTQPVSVTIGGQPAKILYAGTQGTQATWSVLQVNAIVPTGVGSGPQPVVLKIGTSDNSQQNITVWIQ